MSATNTARRESRETTYQDWRCLAHYQYSRRYATHLGKNVIASLSHSVQKNRTVFIVPKTSTG